MKEDATSIQPISADSVRFSQSRLDAVLCLMIIDYSLRLASIDVISLNQKTIFKLSIIPT